jgi:twitching motility protein PilT
VEALERMISAFPADIQSSVSAQLADSFGAVVSQHLRFHEDLGVRLPHCEILRSTTGVKNLIRTGNLDQIVSAMETGASTGMWTAARYREWMDGRSDWHLPPR